MATVIAKNNLEEKITLDDIGGFYLDSLGTEVLSDYFALHQIATSYDLYYRVSVEHITLNNGTNDLSASDAMQYLELISRWHLKTDSGSTPGNTDQIWVNTEDNIAYIYHGDKSKWLSTYRQKFIFSDNNSSCNSKYLKCGYADHSEVGALIPRPATVVGVFGRNTNTLEGRQVEIHNYGSNFQVLDWPNKNVAYTSYDFDIDPGAILQVRAKGPAKDHKLGYPVVYLEVCWRYDPEWDGTVPDGN
jgi:hypothetical protein